MKRFLCSNLRVLKKNNEKRNSLVCKLNKNLYGMTQSCKNWYFKIKGFLGGFGLVSSIQGECFFIRKGAEDIEGKTCRWADFMVLLGIRQIFSKHFKNGVNEKFKISNYGDLSWFLN